MVKKAKPLGVMAAYNKLNGTHCSENKELLTDILRKRWGYEGMVVTDWGAVKDRAKGIAAGQDLEMPGGSGRGTNSILSAIKAGQQQPRRPVPAQDQRYPHRCGSPVHRLHRERAPAHS